MKVQGNSPAAVTDSCEGQRKSSINRELWHACAGPLVTLPPAGSLVVYFPQGHSEQVAASMQKGVDAHIPNYPNLPSKLICLLHNVTLLADTETDEVYAQMTLQPVNTYEKEAILASDLALKPNKPQTEFFCKTLTASDTSTHGGFSVPRRAAEKIFPPLDFSMQPPAQELQARDLHDNTWTFRHIYRGQPKRHLLTTGWSLFVSGKRLFAGDSVLFIRDLKGNLLLGIRRAQRQPTNISSSVLSSDSMHIGILAAAAHAAANCSPFTVFYNPRASPSEFVIPLAKYNKAIYSNQISLGMRFRMMFETEESGTRRYMGTITGISDLDPVRWKGSQWRNIQVGWDESASSERRNRVSIWEIEPVVAPFFICPPPFYRSKRPRQPGMPDDESSDIENLFKRALPWLGEEICIKDLHSQNAVMPGLSLAQWMNMQQNPSLANSAMQSDYLLSLTEPVIQNLSAADLSRQIGFQAKILQQNNVQFNASTPHPTQPVDQVSKMLVPQTNLGSVTMPQQQLQDISLQQRQLNQVFPFNHTQSLPIPPQVLVQTQVHQQQQQQQQQPMIHNLPPQIPQNQPSLQQQQNRMPVQLSQQSNQQLQLSEHQIKLQLLQKLQQQQQALLLQPTPQQPQLVQEQAKLLPEAPQYLTNSHSLQQQHITAQQSTQNIPAGVWFSQPSKHQPPEKLQPQRVMPTELPGTILPEQSPSLFSTPGSCLLTAGGVQSGLTDDAPSCSTSPSTSNCPPLTQPITNKPHRSMITREEMSQYAVTTFSSATGPDTVRELHKSGNHVKPSILIHKAQNGGVVAPRTYVSTTTQMDYLDTSSSATSVCFSQTDGQLQQNFPLSSFDHSPILFRDAAHEGEVLATDPRNNVLFGVNIDDPLGIPLTADPLLAKTIDSGNDYQNHLSSGNVDVVANYSNSKEAKQELSSSIVSQTFGVPDVAFNSIDSSIDDSCFLNKSSWAPPQFQRMRTYTKVYKRGAVGRSIDMTRYSGYDELKQDLARMFSIEGQLEDWQRIGWKLVYVDHEDDVLLVGDDPWEEFVNCVRCIRILSPVEVQQMSMDGDLGNSILPNQACSSSDGGNAWGANCNRNSRNPSAGSYDHFE